MNIHSSNLNLHQISAYLSSKPVHFGAKRSAIWCKTQCVLVLNAVRFGAKRKVKWCKMQHKMLLNAKQKA